MLSLCVHTKIPNGGQVYCKHKIHWMSLKNKYSIMGARKKQTWRERSLTRLSFSCRRNSGLNVLKLPGHCSLLGPLLYNLILQNLFFDQGLRVTDLGRGASKRDFFGLVWNSVECFWYQICDLMPPMEPENECKKPGRTWRTKCFLKKYKTNLVKSTEKILHSRHIRYSAKTFAFDVK